MVLSSWLHAQDVTVSPIDWIEPVRAPDELPAFKKPPRFSIPDELKRSPDIGYVVFDAVLDTKGKRLSSQQYATVAPYGRVDYYDEFEFKPARREGKPVNSAVTFAVLYNPASASAKAADASPRLLEVSVVRVRTAHGASAAPFRTVYADVEVDATGRIASVQNGPAELLGAMKIAARNWRFAPARHAGQAVTAKVNMPFVVATQSPPAQASAKGPMPRPVYQQPPVYPLAMRFSGLRGEVLIDFIVDLEGRPIKAHVVRSLNPAFDEPALTAVRAWRFEPGRIDGVPVGTRMRVPILFVLNGVEGGGGDGLAVIHRADQAKLPPELRYDTAPRLRTMARPVYPYEALKANRTGHAVVTYLVNKSGRVAAVKVQEATSPEFGEALAAAVSDFRYDPALKDGRATNALLSFRQDFSRSTNHGVVSDRDLHFLRCEQKKPETIVAARDLDGSLVPIVRQPPQFPPTITEPATGGEAVIEFIVDDEGTVRLPRIASATQPAFGYAAIQAISGWRFESPTYGGREVAARVQVPIAFEPAPKKPQSREAGE